MMDRALLVKIFSLLFKSNDAYKVYVCFFSIFSFKFFGEFHLKYFDKFIYFSHLIGVYIVF
jgi:hypothetical protein